MERLTYDFCIAGKHCWQVKGADNLECSEVCKSRDDEGCNGCPIANAFDRLAAIEDILGDDYDLNRIKELVQADREGKCIVLPCKVGDSIWEVLDACNFPGNCHATQTCKGCEYREVFKEKQTLTLYMLSESGKLEPPYYVSEKEAEAALEKMKEGK